jgi:hypothetical protein
MTNSAPALPKYGRAVTRGHQIHHERHPQTEAEDLWTTEMPTFIDN